MVSNNTDNYRPGQELQELALGIPGYTPSLTDIENLAHGNISEDIRPGIEGLAERGNIIAQVALYNFLAKAGQIDPSVIPTLGNLPRPPRVGAYQGRIEGTGPLVAAPTPTPSFSDLFRQVMARLKENGINIESDFMAQLELMARLLSRQESGGVERK